MTEKIEKGIAWLGKSITAEQQSTQGILKQILEELQKMNRRQGEILSHLVSLDGTSIQSEGHLSKIEDSSFLTQCAVIRLEREDHDRSDPVSSH